MKATSMQAGQLEKFSRFLADHPGFWPELTGENAEVCGFRIGGSFLTIGDMDRLIEVLDPGRKEAVFPISYSDKGERSVR
jgi:hypothetical protein